MIWKRSRNHIVHMPRHTMTMPDTQRYRHCYQITGFHFCIYMQEPIVKSIHKDTRHRFQPGIKKWDLKYAASLVPSHQHLLVVTDETCIYCRDQFTWTDDTAAFEIYTTPNGFNSGKVPERLSSIIIILRLKPKPLLRCTTEHNSTARVDEFKWYDHMHDFTMWYLENLSCAQVFCFRSPSAVANAQTIEFLFKIAKEVLKHIFRQLWFGDIWIELHSS